jgi:DnaA regulatory inactivator Hda
VTTPPKSPGQLALDFDHRPSLSGEDFLVAPCNADAIKWIDAWPDWPAPGLVVHGPSGSGKTHLANVFLSKTGGRAIAARDLTESEPARLFAASPALVIDDAERALDSDGEVALFHLYNFAAEAGRSLLLTAHRPPARWGIKLADLESRLNACPQAGIGAPDDALIAAVLVKQFADRQLRVDDGVISFMLPRMERTFAAARAAVEAIDKRSLAEQRSVTVPLARRVLDSLSEDD